MILRQRLCILTITLAVFNFLNSDLLLAQDEIHSEAPTKIDNPEVTLKWPAVPGAKKYTLKIFNEQNITLEAKIISTNRYDLIPPAQVFYWSVVADVNKTQLNRSNVARFDVRINKPELQMTKTNGKVSFIPKKIIILPWLQYRFLVSNDADFTKPREFISKNYRLTLPKKIPKETYVKVQLVDLKKNPLSELSPVISLKLKEKSTEDQFRWKKTIFYTFSRGNFEELTPGSPISATSTQISPITFGLALSKKINSQFSYSGSFYIAKVNGGVFATATQESYAMDLPWEIGLTSYANYQRPNWPVEVYGGMDLERLPTFNTDEIVAGATPETRVHTFAYLTGGISKMFIYPKLKLFTKLSYSKSVFSMQSRPSTITEDTFSGSKFILYFNVIMSKHWSYHALYKHHTMSGATELSISRIGAGIGYHF